MGDFFFKLPNVFHLLPIPRVYGLSFALCENICCQPILLCCLISYKYKYYRHVIPKHSIIALYLYLFLKNLFKAKHYFSATHFTFTISKCQASLPLMISNRILFNNFTNIYWMSTLWIYWVGWTVIVFYATRWAYNS